VADLPPGYRDISPDDQKKAQVFFDRGKTVADSGQYEYAIEMFLQGLAIDPDSRDAHQTLREISLKRKASGGKPLGMFEAMKLKSKGKDDKQNLLNAVKLLSYDPGNTDHMLAVMQSAHKGGFYDTCLWIGPTLLRANTEVKPDVNKFLAMKDIYKDLRQWKAAAEACRFARDLRPNDMDLAQEFKNLSAVDTMDQGGYMTGGSFRDSIRDRDKQEQLQAQDRDFKTTDFLDRRIRDAEAEWRADPNEAGKLTKYVEALEATEDPENENKAIELLEDAYRRTKQFRFRQRSGKIKMTQMTRMERTLRAAAQAEPKDEQLRNDYEQFLLERMEFELNEYTLWAEAYPTDLTLRYQMATRLFDLRRFDESIPALQQARSDPKLRVDASVYLGRAFLESGFVDEAVETIQAVIDDYQLKGDDRSKEMYYWQGRAYEEKGTFDMAIKRFSQVAQWEFTYRDVQQRIRALRAKVKPNP
jgi:tetratricopeptide (TPR) repeat protein